MEITGKIKVIGSEQQVSASFKKRELVVTTNTQYPQHIPIEFKQDKTALLDNYKVGQEVKVSTNILGREWVNPSGETKYFLGLEGWRIEKMAAEAPSATMPAAPSFAPATNLNEDEPDDLPF